MFYSVEPGSVKRIELMRLSTGSDDEEGLIETFALKAGLMLTQNDRQVLARTVRRLVEQVRAADAALDGDEPFPAYLT